MHGNLGIFLTWQGEFIHFNLSKQYSMFTFGKGGSGNQNKNGKCDYVSKEIPEKLISEIVEEGILIIND